MELKFTKHQLKCLIDIVDTMSAFTGTVDEDFNKEQERNIKAIDKMLENNGLKRKHN